MDTLTSDNDRRALLNMAAALEDIYASTIMLERDCAQEMSEESLRRVRLMRSWADAGRRFRHAQEAELQPTTR